MTSSPPLPPPPPYGQTLTCYYQAISTTTKVSLLSLRKFLRPFLSLAQARGRALMTPAPLSDTHTAHRGSPQCASRRSSATNPSLSPSLSLSRARSHTHSLLRPSLSSLISPSLSSSQSPARPRSSGTHAFLLHVHLAGATRSRSRLVARKDGLLVVAWHRLASVVAWSRGAPFVAIAHASSCMLFFTVAHVSSYTISIAPLCVVSFHCRRNAWRAAAESNAKMPSASSSPPSS
jgi:hypothetical protein